MATLLDSEEVDEFYATTYGGFSEEVEDREFNYHSPVEDDDEVDSDFSIDENDEPRSDLEDNDGEGGAKKRPKRGLGVQTKAYKEPKREDKAAASKASGSATSAAAAAATSGNKAAVVKAKAKVKTKAVAPHQAAGSKAAAAALMATEAGRKLTRATTVSKTAETAKRQKERAAKYKKLLKRRAQLAAARKDDLKPLTQEEILEEAKITEKLNLESLKRFQEMELEAKKKARNNVSRAIKGQYVRYRSTAMPLIQEVTSNGVAEDKICVDDEPSEPTMIKSELVDPESSAAAPASTSGASVGGGKSSNLVDTKRKQERTFVTFSDFETFRENFPVKVAKQSQQKICPITRVPAKYFDPITRMPYANLQAYRILREAYYSQLELKGDRNDPEVAKWLEWRQRTKGVHGKHPVAASMSSQLNSNTNSNTNTTTHRPPTSVLTNILSQGLSSPKTVAAASPANNASAVPAAAAVAAIASPLAAAATPAGTGGVTFVSPTPGSTVMVAAGGVGSGGTTVTTTVIPAASTTTISSPAAGSAPAGFSVAAATAAAVQQQLAPGTPNSSQRGLSALAVAVRQQQLQQQLQQQQQQQQITQQLGTTSIPIAAGSIIQQQQPTAVVSQQQIVAAAGGSPVAAAATAVRPQQLHQQQSIVLPVRTTPLPQSPSFPITQVIQNPGGIPGTAAATAAGGASPAGLNPPTLPSHPAGTIQTVKIGGQTQVNLAGIPRTMTTTTLTAQQLQQLTGARSGQVFSTAAIQNALRANAAVVGQRTQLITRPATAQSAAAAAAAAAQAQATMLRPQTIAASQVQAISQAGQRGAPTIALQRPLGAAGAAGGTAQPHLGGTPIALAVAPNTAAGAPSAAGIRQTIALNSAGIRTAGGQIVMSQGGAASAVTSTTNSVVSGGGGAAAAAAGAPSAAGRQQQIVVATSSPHPVVTGAAAGMQTRHIVMTHSGGTPVRSGQILQVTGQGGQQHQIVVSQSGQIILNPSSSKQ